MCFDFDGVINSYKSGYLGDGIIPDPPVPGIRDAIDRLRDAGYEVVVLSSRSATKEGRAAMREWLEKYGITVDGIYSTKPPARCYVDHEQSYSCNEVCVYWNSPLIYVMTEVMK